MHSNTDQHWSGYYSQDKDFRLMTSQALSKILTHVDESLPKICLDIGCGTGQLTRELYHRGYRCLGVDSSSKAIELARSNTAIPELEYLHFDIEDGDVSSLPRGPYSFVTCKLVIAFIQNKDAFLQNVKRLLCEGGSFVVVSPTYTDNADATPISVSCDETLQLMKKYFEDVSSFELEGLTYFIAR